MSIRDKKYCQVLATVFYKISTTQDSKNIFLLIRIEFHLIMKNCSSEMHQFESADPVGEKVQKCTDLLTQKNISDTNNKNF